MTRRIRGESEVEALCSRIEERQQERITVVNAVRMVFVKKCRKIAISEDHGYLHKIRLNSLVKWRDDIQKDIQAHNNNKTGKTFDSFSKWLGFRSSNEQLLSILEKGIQIVTYHQERYFHFMDFNIYYVKTESRWPWMRNSGLLAALAMAFFYSFSPIFFCYIAPDEGICPSDPTGQSRPYYGPISAIYFASTTLSTVGYGDLHVSKDSDLQLFFGILYMILANVMLIVAFSSAAESASISIFDRLNEKFLQFIWGNDDNELVFRKIRRASFLRIGQIIVTFVFLNLIGVFATRIYIAFADEASELGSWSWMTSIYWAIQTTTTIGYGDLKMSFGLRWFQIFYLIVSTYFVGNTLGGLAALKDEIASILSHTAWSRRKNSKGLIEELQPYENDGKIDQYEWALASLVILGKVRYDDLLPIMDKFRDLAGQSGFIEEPEENEEEPENDLERAKGGNKEDADTDTTTRKEDIPSQIGYDADDQHGEFGRGMMMLFGLNVDP